MDKNKRSFILGGALSLTVSALVVKILGVIYKVPLSYLLGDTGMGYFNTAYTIYGLFYVLCSAGVPKAITCIISEYDIKHGRDYGHLIYSFSLKLFSIIGAGVTIIFMSLAPLIVRVITNEKALLTLLLIGPSILFVATGGVVRGYVSALGRLGPIAVSQVIEAVCKLALGLLFALVGIRLKLPVDVVAAIAILGITVGSLLSTLYLILHAKRLNIGKKAKQKYCIDKKKLVKQILKIALPITVGSSVLTLSSVIDMTVIMRCLKALGYTHTSANEIYGNYTTLAIPMFNLVVSLVTPLTVYLLPELIKFRLREDKRDFEQRLNRVVLLTVCFVAPCACAYYFYSFDILDVLFTASQSAIGFEMLSILSLGLVFLSVLNVLNTAHEAMGKFTVTIISLAIGVGIKVVIEPILILKTGLGVLGVPVSTLISYLVGLNISAIALWRQGINIKIIKNVIVPISSAVLSFALPYYTVYSSGALGTSLFGMLSVWFISAGIYLLIILLTYLLSLIFVKGVNIHKNNILSES